MFMSAIQSITSATWLANLIYVNYSFKLFLRMSWSLNLSPGPGFAFTELKVKAMLNLLIEALGSERSQRLP
jgi:hypothetical protein